MRFNLSYGHRIHFPALALAEVAGGVARRKRDPAKAALAVSRLLRILDVIIMPETKKSALEAARLAGKYFLCGADSVCCQLAQQTRAPLITLGLEMQLRSPESCCVLSPRDWLASHNQE